MISNWIVLTPDVKKSTDLFEQNYDNEKSKVD